MRYSVQGSPDSEQVICMYRYEYLLLHSVSLVRARPEPPKGYSPHHHQISFLLQRERNFHLTSLVFRPTMEDGHSFYSYLEEHPCQSRGVEHQYTLSGPPWSQIP